MKLLKKEMSRRDFLKYSFSTMLLLGLGSMGINLKSKPKKQINNSQTGYGNGGYGR